MKLSSHPSVIAYRKNKSRQTRDKGVVSSKRLKQIAASAGADDSGIIDLSREPVLPHKEDIALVMPETKGMMILAARVNQTPLRSLAHSVADQEFKRVWEGFKAIEGQIIDELTSLGIKSVGMPIGFPMELGRWPKQVWLTNEKLFAVEAGMGQMGVNRLVLHPKFGAGILFGTILLANECDTYDQPLDYNPCIGCGLCISVCPTGAVKGGDHFDFAACYSHNYRERLGGFINWVEQVAESRTAKEYRARVSDNETLSMWQNLSVGSQTRCDRCMAVCPAGETAIGEFLEDKKTYINKYHSRFREVAETIYAVKGSDAQAHVLRHFPNKVVKLIGNGLRPLSVEMFLTSLPRMFQPNQSKGLSAVFHFTFTGKETAQATITIKEKTIRVEQGLKENPDLALTADSKTWIKFLGKEAGLFLPLLTGKIKIKGSPLLMKKFANCFPS